MGQSSRSGRDTLVYESAYDRKWICTTWPDRSYDLPRGCPRPDEFKPMLRQNWADRSADWYVRRDGSKPDETDLIDPLAAACLQIGYYSEMVVFLPSFAIDSLLAAVSCLEGRVVEEQRIELANYLQGAQHRDQIDAPVVCHRVSRYSTQMLKENESLYEWYVLGQELGRSTIRRRASETELGTLGLVQSYEVQSAVNVLAEGWRLFPLPSVWRIENYLTMWFPGDPAEMHSGEQISTLAEYWNEVWSLAAKNGSPTVYTPASVDYSPGSASPDDKDQQRHDEDPNSFENVLRIVTEIVKATYPSFTKIGELVIPRLYVWSDDEVRRLLEVPRISVTATTMRWALVAPEAEDKTPAGLQKFISYHNRLKGTQKKEGGGNNQRVRLVLRMLERLGEYDNFGEDKAAPKEVL